MVRQDKAGKAEATKEALARQMSALQEAASALESSQVNLTNERKVLLDQVHALSMEAQQYERAKTDLETTLVVEKQSFATHQDLALHQLRESFQVGRSG